MSDWNPSIIEEFRANEGRVGGMFEGAPMILIHHVGAKTGTERVSPLVYFPEDGGRMLIIASKGGSPTNPDWYHNLKANPRINVEVGTQTFPYPPRNSTRPSATRSGRDLSLSDPASANTRNGRRERFPSSGSHRWTEPDSRPVGRTDHPTLKHRRDAHAVRAWRRDAGSGLSVLAFGRGDLPAS